MRTLLIAFLLILIRLGVTEGIAQASISAPNDNSEIDLSKSLEYLIDDSALLQFENVLKENEALPWKQVEAKSPSFGITKGRIWFRFELINDDTVTKNIVFVLRFARLDKVVYMRPDLAGFYESTILSMFDKRSYRELESPTFSVPIEVGPQSRAMHYFYIENQGQISVPVTLQGEKYFIEEQKKNQTIYGIYLGCVLVMIAYNLFLYLSLRDKSYLFYVAYIATFALTVVTIAGVGRYMLWPDSSVFWEERSMHVFGGSSFLFFIFFAQNYLKTREWIPRFHQYLTVLAIVEVIQLCYGLISPRGVSEVTASITTLVIFPSVIIAAFLTIRRTRTALFFLAASLAFMLGVIAFNLQLNGALPSNLAFDEWAMFSSAAEIVLLSMGLADRINRLNAELNTSSQALRKTNKALSQEIQERQRAQELVEKQHSIIVRNERLRIMGQMAGSIAHEIKGPIASIQNGIQQLFRLLNLSVFDKNLADQALRRIERTTDRLLKVSQSISSLSRNSSSLPLEKVPLKKVIDDCIDLSQERFKLHNVQLSVTMFDNDLSFECRPTQVSQVLLNLFANAIEAVSEQESKWVHLEVVDHGTFFDICVIDNGPQISEEVREHLFSLFFTTKAYGEGTGLGLNISRTLAELHGGQLFLDESSMNTKFVLRLPKVQTGSKVEAV